METQETLKTINQDKKIYYPEVDWCKGFAIILMVLGHVFTYTQNTEIEKIIQIIIYTFHMPFFFMLSGITLNMQYTTRQFLIKKAKTLLIPAVLFSIYNVLLYIVYLYLFSPEQISMYIKSILSWPSFFYTIIMSCKSTCSAYWFLPVLFSAEIIYFCCEKWKLERIKKLCFLGGIVFSIILYQKGIVLPLGIEEALLVLPFLDLGLNMRNKSITLTEKTLVFGLYILGIIIWFRRGYTIIDLYNSNIPDILLFYLLGMSASLVILMVVKQRKMDRCKVLRWIGRNSIYVYGLHYSFLPFWRVINSKVSVEKVVAKVLWDLIGVGIIIGACSVLIFIIKQIKRRFNISSR